MEAKQVEREAKEGELLAPAGAQFFGVSPALAKVRLFGAGLFLLPALILSVVIALHVGSWFYVFSGVLVVIALWLLWLIPRQVRAIAYATTDTDLLVRRGILFRRLDVVPYGRIQFVDVQEGPVSRFLGIATLTLNTASASTDASLPGVPADRAAQLRDLLVTLGSDNLSGL